MPYWQLFYHLVWSTKNREPLLTAQVEPIIYGYLREKVQALGATLYALGGVKDHVHMIVAIPPKMAISTFTGQVKAVASTRFNKEHPEHPAFFWQAEYSAFSLDKKRLPQHVAYAKRQKEHHTQRTIIGALESRT